MGASARTVISAKLYGSKPFVPERDGVRFSQRSETPKLLLLIRSVIVGSVVPFFSKRSNLRSMVYPTNNPSGERKQIEPCWSDSDFLAPNREAKV